MALRQLASRWRGLTQTGPSVARAMSSAPSVYDVTVDITVIDKVGRRHTLRGLQGQSLVDLLQAHAATLGEDAVAPSPEGRGCSEAHVKLPNELLAKYPAPEGDDARTLHEVADEFNLDQHSRLASKIVLDPSMSGTVVALGKHYPWRSL